MSLNAHLAELERKHQALDKKVAEELAHPHQNDIALAKLKRQKLVLKDEITRLRRDKRQPDSSVH